MPQPSRHRYGEDDSQFVDLWESAGHRKAAVVLIHGGYWRDRYHLHLMDPLAAHLASRGTAVANIEYRRIRSDAPDPAGVWGEMAADVADAVRLAAGRFGERTPICVIGHSAGGQLALWAGAEATVAPVARPPITFVVGLAPLADLAEADRRGLSDGATASLLGGSHKHQRARYRDASPIDRVPIGVQQLIVHGRNDQHVPFDLSASYAQAAADAGDPIELLAPDDADHFAVIDPAAPVWRAIDDRLELVFGAADS